MHELQNRYANFYFIDLSLGIVRYLKNNVIVAGQVSDNKRRAIIDGLLYIITYLPVRGWIKEAVREIL